MKVQYPREHGTVTILHYIGCKPEGYTNLPAARLTTADSGLAGGEVVSADVDSDLKHLASGNVGTWRFPEKLTQAWRRHAGEALAQATTILKGLVVRSEGWMKECGFVGVRGLEHLGILVNFKTRTILRRGYADHATFTDGKYWRAVQVILKQGPTEIAAEAMQQRYGANDACRSAVAYLRKRLEPLRLYISDRKYAVVDLEDYLRQQQHTM